MILKIKANGKEYGLRLYENNKNGEIDIVESFDPDTQFKEINPENIINNGDKDDIFASEDLMATIKIPEAENMDETKEMDKIVEMINDEYDLYGTALEKLTEDQLRNIVWNEVFPEIYDKILKTFREWAIDHVLEMLEEDQEYAMEQFCEWLKSNSSGIMLVISRDQNGITEGTIKNLEGILNKRSHEELMCLARMI